MRWIAIGVLNVVMLVVSPLGSGMARGQTTPAPPAPAFEIVTASGDTFSNVTLKGQPVLLVFWAPWCTVCQRELPELANSISKESRNPCG